MRRILLLASLLVVGCRPMRLVDVTNDGVVASTSGTGTFVAGKGRVAEGSQGIAFSPDGKSLAVALPLNEGTLLWPSGRRFQGLSRPYAWSSDGRSLAGGFGSVRVLNVASGAVRDTPFIQGADHVRFMPDGRLLAYRFGEFAIEGGPKIVRRMVDVRDVMPTPAGEVRWIEVPVGGPNRSEQSRTRQALAAPVRVGRWSPATGATTFLQKGAFGALLSPPAPDRLTVPTDGALSPRGDGFATSFLEVRATKGTVDRLVALYDKARLSKADEAELDRLLATAKADSVVAWFGDDGTKRTLDRTPFDPTSRGWGIDTLAFSPNGRWLAVGRRDGTLRIPMP